MANGSGTNNHDDGAVRWAEPPDYSPQGRGKFDPDEVYTELHDNPGEWGIIAEDVSASYRATSPLIKQLEDKNVEIRVVRVNGKRTVYARYLPSARGNSGRRRNAA